MEPRPTVQVLLAPANIWRAGLVLAAVVAAAFFVRFVLVDAGSLIAMLVMAWFLSLAMEPAVRRLSRRVRRGTATLLVMTLFIVALVIFFLLFGSLLVRQVAVLLKALPDVITGVVDQVNARFGTRYDISAILDSLNLTPQQAASYAQGALNGVLGLVGTVAGTVFNLFTLLLLTFYLSADGPALRRWIAQLLPGRVQQVFINVWDVSTVKTGGYVSSRLVLATINGVASALVFLALGMPSWLALGAWTGLVAQLVPTIGTYISIALPVVVGLVSPRPWIGLAALGWGVLYQQVENLTLEPKISSRAVDIHPGVSFAAVILGASLFGAMGALLAIPVVAMLHSLVDTFVTRQELQEFAATRVPPPAGGRKPPPPK
ncbi:AI-2E family transporter [Nonomuraea sp. LP-02]|uniref:AI-2E family transporter n=1 Tax=Nonomuraea sp. LP-02 TaxID=3097960 RepID=UPI002E37A72C|nr:AI-2E family transporter [Nonomuraea sp. LP-02]MED7929141.1 AI-2E family transporter [Nonomuraea sp. LP-02]